MFSFVQKVEQITSKQMNKQSIKGQEYKEPSPKVVSVMLLHCVSVAAVTAL